MSCLPQPYPDHDPNPSPIPNHDHHLDPYPNPYPHPHPGDWSQVEALDEVERAFVHVDYKQRDEPEHKVERNLQQGARNLFSAHDSVRHQVPPRPYTLI